MKSTLHLNWVHLVFNLALLLWIERIVEKRVRTRGLLLIYMVSMLISGTTILIKYIIAPSQGSAVGASGAIFGSVRVIDRYAWFDGE